MKEIFIYYSKKQKTELIKSENGIFTEEIR